LEAGRDFWEGRFKPLNCYKKTKPPMKREGMNSKAVIALRFKS
jgi:hypothetical protein